MKLKTIRQLKDIKGKNVLLRVDTNVQYKEVMVRGQKRYRITDDTRIRAVEPTIRLLSRMGAKIILMSHLGRPKGKDPEKSMYPVFLRLKSILKRNKVKFADDCRGETVRNALLRLKPREVLVLENLRYYKEEENNDQKFAKELASFGDIYVNDAFAVCHRKHASVDAITKYIDAYAGLLVEEEISNLNKLFKKPKKPFMALIGGAKISTKIGVLQNLLKSVDYLLIGGAMANNFIKASGFEVGKSLIEKSHIKDAKRLLASKRDKVFIPMDVITAKEISNEAKLEHKHVKDIKKNDIIVDIGPETIKQYAKIIKKANTLIWNGPMGLFEIPRMSHGSVILGRLIASRSGGRAFGIVGGGETIACLEMTKMAEYVDYISTAGGAMLAYLEGKSLPGLKPLMK